LGGEVPFIFDNEPRTAAKGISVEMFLLHAQEQQGMSERMRMRWISLVASLVAICVFALPAHAQQTLGGITGKVSGSSGGVLPNTTVTIVGDQTKLTRTQVTTDSGSYDFVNLPIGTYTMTFTHDGFTTQKIPSITVEADRTATVNTTLRVGQVGTTITVEE
jgi:Carboxypeptidase regulatory-like domain